MSIVCMTKICYWCITLACYVTHNLLDCMSKGHGNRYIGTIALSQHHRYTSKGLQNHIVLSQTQANKLWLDTCKKC